MALSQIQCLDDNHVNPRTHESKPEFLYCEDQRLALEALLRDGREAFAKCLRARGLRGFLSDPEQETLAGLVEPYDPGSELFAEGAEDDDPPLSLHYWPELSDTSIPQMDLGWPDSEAYRGVTRTTVYTQPPLDGQTHIKEIVRKMIAQAQKVIAVVMDVFTDVDIFRDLLDAGFKRRVSVYILLERTTLPHFLSMCQRANMHAGHLKHLRVRCSEGTEFYTRSCTKVRGQLGHRFMFVDGDKAVSGSYSFTWMSSRLDRNLITVVTGQAVDAFDRLFRFLYATSSFVDLRQVATEPEPEPEPVVQPASVAPPSAALARKLYNPKYALLLAGNPSLNPSSGPKEPQNSDTSKNPEDSDTKKRKRKGDCKDAIQQAPPLHPGLTNLEKACLISYLPTWPEPDPPSDVIGFINIRDASKPTQVHLQRSQMFETSQAIRFSSPFSMPKETLPEVAQPRQRAVKHEEANKPQPTQNKTKAVAAGVQPTQLNAEPGDVKTKEQAPEPKSSALRQKPLNTENNLQANTKQNAGHNTTAHLSAHAPSQPQSLPGSNTKKEAETSFNTQTDVVHRTRPLELSGLADSRSDPHRSSKTAQTPAVHSHIPASSASAAGPQADGPTWLSQNNRAPIPTSVSTSAFSTSFPPVPKPRTVQLVIKDDGSSDSQKLLEVSVVRRPESLAGTEPPAVHSQPHVANAMQTPPQKKPETVPQLQNNSGSKAGAQTDPENTGNPKEAPQQKQNVTSQEMRRQETVGLHDDRAATQSAAGTKPQARSDVLMTDAPKADSVNIQKQIPKEAEPKSLTPAACKISPETETGRFATEQTDTGAPGTTFTGCEFAKVPHDRGENVIQGRTHLARAQAPQRLSSSGSNPAETVDSLKASAHTSVSATANSRGGGDSTHSQWGDPSVASTQRADATPNTRASLTSQESQQNSGARGSSTAPETPTRLRLSDSQAPVRTSTPDGPPPRTPTPDSRTHTPDPRAHTPDFRMPTPDVSDGYASPRDDSTLSTTSEEYFECSDSPFRDPVWDRAAVSKHGTTEDHGGAAHPNSPSAVTIPTTAAGPACINNSTRAGPAGVSTSSSPPEKVKTGEGKDATNEENGSEEGENGRKVAVAERRTERDSPGTERRGGDDAKRTADHLKRAEEPTQVAGKDEEAHSPKRKRVLSQPAAERQVDGGATPRVSANKVSDAKRPSTGDLKLQRASSDRGTVDRGKAADKAALRPRSVERRDRPQSAGETEGRKLLHRTSSTSQPPRPPRPLSAPQPVGARAGGSRQSTQAESKVLHGSFQILDNASSSRRPPSRPPPPQVAGAVGSATGRKQVEVSHSQHSSLLSRQPLTTQSRARVGQSPNQPPGPKPPASFLHTHSNMRSQLHPPTPNQTASVQEAQRQEEGKAPFTLTFSRLYTLKGLKDKMSKLPAPSKRGSTGSPVQGRKSTS